MGMKNSKTTILTVPEMTLHESAPPLLGPALGVQKPVIKKLKENFLRSLIIESFKYENINIWATSDEWMSQFNKQIFPSLASWAKLISQFKQDFKYPIKSLDSYLK